MDDAQKKFNKEIGARIRWQREFLEYSREALSEMADISTQFLADIEMGRKSMTAITLKKLSESLHVTTDYLIFGNEKPDSEPLPLTIDFIDNYNHIITDMNRPEREGAQELLKTYAKALIQIKTSEDEDK